MNVLVLGSGVRETAIIRKLVKDSDGEINITCIGTNNNPYIVKVSTLFVSSDLSNLAVRDIVSNMEPALDFAIIGPEAPLANGIADILEGLGIPCIGPRKALAQIETSKSYARNLLVSIGLDDHLPRFLKVGADTKLLDIKEFVDNQEKIVIKKDGLCGGKGVIVEDIDFESSERLLVVSESMREPVVIEEKLFGEEFSLMSITDGAGNVRHFPPIQDYKRLNEGDTGPNTGSMGCLIDRGNTLPFLRTADVETAQRINKTVIEHLNKIQPYRGILYGSFIRTVDSKIKVIEFNSRLGDPEAVIALELLQTNFCDLCETVARGQLSRELSFSHDAMVGVYMVPKDYPQRTSERFDIYIGENSIINRDYLFYGAVEQDGDHLFSLSSRTLFYLARGEDIYSCYNKIYSQLPSIVGQLHYRKDIGAKYLTEYEKSGVSISKGDEGVRNIKRYIEATYTDAVLGKHGDFGGQIRLGEHTLVSSIDGVGTKSVMAHRSRGKESFVNLGKDIVNHSVNDILVQGALPLFFMDYYGTNNLDTEELAYFIQGVSEACIENNSMVLLGGETAEMPLIYREDMTDLVGCIVGTKDNTLLGSSISCGDRIIGFVSVGPHTNGFSLINKLENIDAGILDTLLAPHRSYLPEVLRFKELFGEKSINGMCHITGGGLHGNLSRIIPEGLTPRFTELPMAPWAQYLMDRCGLPESEMRQIYNCGIGYLLIIDGVVYDRLKASNPEGFEYIDLGTIEYDTT